MKIFGWSLAFFFSFFAIGWFLSAQTPATSVPVPPISGEPAAAAKPPAPPLDSSKTSALLSSARGAELFAALFDQRVLADKKFPEIEPPLAARFRSAYPTEEAAFHRELASRLGILKALAATFDEGGADRDAVMGFYRGLAFRPKENFLVRRQALQNLSVWIKSLPEQRRNELISRLPASLVASAPFSERELLEGIFTDAQ